MYGTGGVVGYWVSAGCSACVDGERVPTCMQPLFEVPVVLYMYTCVPKVQSCVVQSMFDWCRPCVRPLCRGGTGNLSHRSLVPVPRQRHAVQSADHRQSIMTVTRDQDLASRVEYTGVHNTNTASMAAACRCPEHPGAHMLPSFSSEGVSNEKSCPRQCSHSVTLCACV